MYEYLTSETVHKLSKDLTSGIIDRTFIETPAFRDLYGLTDWSPFCENIWKYEDLCRMFVRNNIFLFFMCDFDGCVNKVSIGNLAVEWKTIWSK